MILYLHRSVAVDVKNGGSTGAKEDPTDQQEVKKDTSGDNARLVANVFFLDTKKNIENEPTTSFINGFSNFSDAVYLSL